MNTAIEIIEDTVEWYSQDVDRRSIIDSKCSYDNSNGNKCAVGRFLSEYGLSYVKKNLLNNVSIGNIFYLWDNADTFKNQILVPEVSWMSDLGFWAALQELHDEDCYWTSNGLSAEGKAQVVMLKNKYIHLKKSE